MQPLEGHAPASLILPREDDSKWPEKNKDGRQELEIRLGNEHISFEVCPPDHDALKTANATLDSQDWITSRRHGICGSRRASGFLLSCPRSQSSCILAHLPSFQGMDKPAKAISSSATELMADLQIKPI